MAVLRFQYEAVVRSPPLPHIVASFYPVTVIENFQGRLEIFLDELPNHLLIQEKNWPRFFDAGRLAKRVKGVMYQEESTSVGLAHPFSSSAVK